MRARRLVGRRRQVDGEGRATVEGLSQSRIPLRGGQYRVDGGDWTAFDPVDGIWDGEFEGRFEDREFAIGVFNAHNEQVRATVPADRLVVHEISDGWEPLADMLGVPVPDTPFPHLNDTAAFREMMGMPALPV